MRIYIVGSVASGKSTLARQVSEKTGIPCYHLDEVLRVADPAAKPWGNRKRPEDEIDRLFNDALAGEYVMEDNGRERFLEGMRRADQVVLLDIPLAIRYWRIISRWIKQRLGSEACIYLPGWRMLTNMFRWARNFDTGKDGVRERIKPFAGKTVVLRTKRDVSAYVEGLCER